MILINILHGSSCVGKSTYMKNSSLKFYKVEMDDCEYWRFNIDLWSDLCINNLIQHITKNLAIISKTKIPRNMLITCGGLPTPNHVIYERLESTFGVIFRHTLFLTENMKQLVNQIKMRGRENIQSELIEHYHMREKSRHLYHEVIVNKY